MTERRPTSREDREAVVELVDTAAGEARPQQAKGTTRVAALEVARALAVIGVVVNHATDGLVAAGLLDAASPTARVNAALYLFRMPALALLMGLFVPGGVTRRGARSYLRRRVVTVLYLYVLWFYLQSAVEIAANGVKNQARDPSELLTPWVTFGQLWFLPFLAVATAVVVVCRPWRSRSFAISSLLVALVIAILTWGWNLRIAGAEGLSLVVFTMVGAVIGLPRIARGLERHVAVWVVVAVAGTIGVVLLHARGAVPATVGVSRPPLGTVATSLGAAACGVAMLIAVAALLARTKGIPRRLFAAVGSRTLAIFLAHVTVVAGTRIVLVRLGVTEPHAILAVAVVLGVTVPVLVSRWAEARTPWRWLFDAPIPLRGR